MNLKVSFDTDRLLLNPINEADAEFIQELVNTEGWKKYIGDRNVNSRSDAENYIKRINSQPGSQTWTVKRVEDQASIGIITYIKRDYLEYHDLGFAFLPAYQKNGYAFEASNTVLNFCKKQPDFKHLFAITLPENIESIRLLVKLEFRFKNEIEEEEERLLVYKL